MWHVGCEMWHVCEIDSSIMQRVLSSRPFHYAQANIPTQKEAPRQGARFPQADEVQGWPKRVETPPRQGTQEAHAQRAPEIIMKPASLAGFLLC